MERKLPFGAPDPASPSGRNFDWPSVNLPHPDSPAGRFFNWQSLGLPHPNSPAGRVNWRVELLGRDRQGTDAHRRIEKAAEILVERLFNKLRDALPDSSLKALF